MKNLLFMGLCVVLVILGSFVMWRRAQVSVLSEQYGKIVALSERDISYRSKQLPMFGGGLLFYQVQFKDIPFDHEIDKLSISVIGQDIQVSLYGVRFRIEDALRAKGELVQFDLQTYVPYKSIWAMPLESLALAGFNKVSLNTSFWLKKDGLSRQVIGYAEDKKIGRVEFDFYIPAEMNKISPSELSQATVLDGSFDFHDAGFVEPYRTYAKTIGIREPDEWLSGIMTR
ncbi:MAG: hypothetical protein IKY98_01925 [Alphaproteobacteria bacterium]|nr:hypothetical protein [Alphaproteobacteria bacterium]